MLIIPCPWCGERDESEFSYGGLARPLPSLDADAAAWRHALYSCDNPMGWREELWFHGFGCRQWIVVRRHTVSQKVVDSRPPENPS